MTLILGMSKAEGIYMCTDYRLTRAGAIIDDATVKFLTVHYPPFEGGPKALVSFTGIAILPDGTPTGTWIRQTLRGEGDSFDDSMAHLLSRLNRDIAPFRQALMVNVLALQGERRYFGGLSNLRLDHALRPAVQRSFGYDLQELTAPFFFRNGSGAARVVSDGHEKRVVEQLSIIPRRPMDHLGLLAAVNRRVAAKESTVSPFCQAGFVNADDRYSPHSCAFAKPGESIPFDMPMVLCGIDLTGLAARGYAEFMALKEGRDPAPLDDEEAKREQDRRP